MSVSDSRHEITMPDLHLAETATSLSVWLVAVGTEVVAGDRIVEILAGDVIVDLPAPATGTLVETFVVEDDPVATGQVLGIVRSS